VPFRGTFDCLWCGTPHTCRGPDDIEGWAQLCPECVGKAGDNGFLRFRLRDAITERGAAAAATAPTTTPDDSGTHDPDPDDRLLRRGRYARGPIHDAAWHAELDAAGRWLDGLALEGEIVELAAGTGWWSPLLASKGELWAYDATATALDRARDRLVAHGLRAHLHARDPWQPADRTVGALFTGFWLGRVPSDRLEGFLGVARRWLSPGGTYAFIDALADPQSGADERESATVTFHEPAEIEAALFRAGFTSAEVTTTGRFLMLGRATA
jgi:demethylmenaquinone methyltransferase/2-methoxy-6-polyprenyl-1,4-benzoquinol methylase